MPDMKITAGLRQLYKDPLPHGTIRLMGYKPQPDPNDPPDCNLHTTLSFSVTDQGRIKYKALSYSWGQSLEEHSISCNGIQLGIRTTLFVALKQIWSLEPDALIWIDAVSIDQVNLREKSEHVAAMHSIFAGAEEVMIWLGEANDEIKSIWPFLQVAIENRDETLATLSEALKTPADLEDSSLSITVAGSTSTAGTLFRALLDISSREWFTRAWTFQEVVLAQKAIVWCGPHRLPWLGLMGLCLPILQATGFYELPMAQSLEVLDNLLKLPGPRPLSLLLDLKQWRNTTVPIDKIFAVLGLLDRSQYPDLKSDYTMPTSKAYIMGARSCIDADGDLRILSAAGLQSGWCKWNNIDPLSRYEGATSGHEAETDEYGRRYQLNAEIAMELPSWTPNWNDSSVSGRSYTSTTLFSPDLKEQRWGKVKRKPCDVEDGIVLAGVPIAVLQDAPDTGGKYVPLSELPASVFGGFKLVSPRDWLSSLSPQTVDTSPSTTPDIVTNILSTPAPLSESRHTTLLTHLQALKSDWQHPILGRAGDWLVGLFGGAGIYILRPLDENGKMKGKWDELVRFPNRHGFVLVDLLESRKRQDGLTVAEGMWRAYKQWESDEGKGMVGEVDFLVQ